MSLSPRRRACTLSALFALAAAAGMPQAGCAPQSHSASTPTTPAALPVATIDQPTMGDQQPKDYPGIHNLVAYHPGFISGGAPEGAKGYDTLAGMGIHTIISVDGAVPPVSEAAARGMRYIHLPIGYNGFTEERKLQLVRATRDAMQSGPVYIHCHHGKHRSAGAAAAVAASLGWLSPEQGVERMKVSGTAPNYTGLYRCAETSDVLAVEVIDSVPAEFPSVSRPSNFVQSMVEIDEVFDHLKAIEKAGWKPPADHPDLVPVAEAGRLADLFRLASGLDDSTRKPADFQTAMRADTDRAQQLEDMLAGSTPDLAKLSANLKLLGASCKDCHAKYRD